MAETENDEVCTESSGYVRKERPHKTQPPVDDAAADQALSGELPHSPTFSSKGSPITGHVYRQSRSDLNRVQKSLKYGQYLEIPNGKRTIFESQAQKKRRRNLVIAFAVIVILLAFVIIWKITH